MIRKAATLFFWAWLVVGYTAMYAEKAGHCRIWSNNPNAHVCAGRFTGLLPDVFVLLSVGLIATGAPTFRESTRRESAKHKAQRAA